MNAVELFVRHDAELDAIAYAEHIGEHSPDASLRFLAAIDRTIAGLARQPLKGRLRRFRAHDLKNIRSWRVDDFEHYLIFYLYAGTRLEILRIRHGAMKFPRALRRRPK